MHAYTHTHTHARKAVWWFGTALNAIGELCNLVAYELVLTAHTHTRKRMHTRIHRDAHIQIQTWIHTYAHTHATHSRMVVWDSLKRHRRTWQPCSIWVRRCYSSDANWGRRSCCFRADCDASFERAF
jgi:hypothetical protein